MTINEIINYLGTTDVYLVDQIMKGRYQPGDTILDAGCGTGRNMDLLLRCGISVTGVDQDQEAIRFCKAQYPDNKDDFTLQDLSSLSFENATFDHIISSAVFHFAQSVISFEQMVSEHIRVLKMGGTFFVRMTSLFGLPPETAVPLGDGRYHLPNYGDRFLITYPILERLQKEHNLKLIEPIKTVNVQDNRAMSVLLFEKGR